MLDTAEKGTNEHVILRRCIHSVLLYALCFAASAFYTEGLVMFSFCGGESLQHNMLICSLCHIFEILKIFLGIFDHYDVCYGDV